MYRLIVKNYFKIIFHAHFLPYIFLAQRFHNFSLVIIFPYRIIMVYYHLYAKGGIFAVLKHVIVAGGLFINGLIGCF